MVMPVHQWAPQGRGTDAHAASWVTCVWGMQIEQMEAEMQAAKQEAASQVAAARKEAAAAKEIAHREAQQHGASTMASAMEREATLSNSLSDLRAEYEASCRLPSPHMSTAI